MALDKLDLPSLLINLWISSPTNLFDNWKYMWPHPDWGVSCWSEYFALQCQCQKATYYGEAMA